MDWNSDGEWDIVSGDRNGYFNVFIRDGDDLVPYYQYKLMDSTVLSVGYNSQPAVVDWNGDGKKDLLLGTETGYIRFYPNQTDDTWPMFQSFTNIEANGSLIYLNRVNPYVFDLDQDGVQDLICGANDGYVRFYRNIGTNEEPELAREESLKTVAGVPIRPSGSYYGSRCGFGDWNNDSVPDFLLSGFDGLVELFLGAPTVGVEERSTLHSSRLAPGPTIVRGSLVAAVPGVLLDVTGKRVAVLQAGRNELGYLPAGVYVCRMDCGATSARRIVFNR